MHAHLSNKGYGRSADHTLLSTGFENGAVGTISTSVAVTADGGIELLGSEGYCKVEGGFVGIPGSITTVLKGASRARLRSRASIPTRRRWRTSAAP